MIIINKVILIGRLTKDPEVNNVGAKGTARVSFNLAVDKYEDGEKSADFIPVVVWGASAENLAKYCSKGSQISVSGRISVRSYDAQDGSKRYITEVVADQFNGIEFLSRNNSGPQQNNNTHMGFDGIAPVDDGDMPFN